jgi:hypothetical protein
MTHIEKYVLPYFKEPGVFLEIGCWRGGHLSQSIELESVGWHGVCVDPFPYDFDNRKCKLISSAVSKDGLPREFIKVSIDKRHGGDVSYFSGFKDSIPFHWPVIEEHCKYKEIVIQTIKFDDIGLPGHINFMSVDTEGSELEIMRSIDFSCYTFDMIMFEHNGVANGVGRLLEANGYKLYQRLPIDDIFVRL